MHPGASTGAGGRTRLLDATLRPFFCQVRARGPRPFDQVTLAAPITFAVALFDTMAALSSKTTVAGATQALLAAPRPVAGAGRLAASCFASAASLRAATGQRVVVARRCGERALG